jgi:cell envelope opacity-associated protein A
VKRKRVGRPAKPANERLSVWVLVRLTKTEHRAFRQYAKQQGTTMAQVLRSYVLHQTGIGDESKLEGKNDSSPKGLHL